MKNKCKVVLSFIIIFTLITCLSVYAWGQEVTYTYELCLDTKNALDQEANELRHQNDTVERDLLAAEHNVAVDNFNIRCSLFTEKNPELNSKNE